MVNDKKYGDPDFGCTLAELKLHAELAQTINGISIEGNARKAGAILAVAGAGSELITEIEQLQALQGELVKALGLAVELAAERMPLTSGLYIRDLIAKAKAVQP